jgi:hypothetical protein
MTTKRLPSVKQGTTFSVYLDYSFNSIAEVFPASDLSAQVRADNNLLLTQLAITADPLVVGRFIATATPAQTLNWPLGDAYFDVKRVSGGVTTVTDTVAFEVLKKVTA